MRINGDEAEVTGNDLVNLLIKYGDQHPSAFIECDWNLLTTEDWIFLLTCYTEPNQLTESLFIDFCPWMDFDEEQIYDLIYYRPEFAHKVDWGCLSRYKVETLAEKYPHLYHYRLMFT